MILFSSLNQWYEFLIFVYLGLLSGLIFQIINKNCMFFLQKIKKAEKQPKNPNKAKNKTNTQKKQVQAKFRENKPLKPKRRIVLKRTFVKSFNLTIKVILKTIPIIGLIFVSVFSYVINLKFNFGFVKVIYVLGWVGFFFVGKTLCNLLANYFFAFYNWIIKRNKKCQNKTTIIKENPS